MSPDGIPEATCKERQGAIRELISQRIAHERELVDQRFLLTDKALELHAAELSRWVREMNQFKIDTEKALSAASARTGTWAVVITMALALLSLALRFLPL